MEAILRWAVARRQRLALGDAVLPPFIVRWFTRGPDTLGPGHPSDMGHAAVSPGGPFLDEDDLPDDDGGGGGTGADADAGPVPVDAV